MLGVRLPEDLDLRLSALSKMTHRPKSYYVKEALAEYLNEYEEMYKTIEQYEEQKRDGTLETITLEDLIKKNGISREDLEAVDLEGL